MSLLNEAIQINYGHRISYSNADLNAIGSTTSTTLRTVDTISGDTAYVRKFGKDYAITQITNAVISNPRSDGGGANQWRFNFYGWNGTAWVLMARVTDANGASAFTDVADFAASKIRIELELLAGTIAITDGDDIDLTTNIDTPLSILLSGEGNDMDGFFWYLSDSGSTYYDEDYKYGGYRHSPALGSERLPFFHPIAAYSSLDSANDGVVVLDSETYEVPDWDSNRATSFILAASGQTPRLTAGVGARVTREVENDGNNTDTRYVGKTGINTNPGTYQEPYLTIQYGENNMGGRTWLDVIDSNVYDTAIDVSGNTSIESCYGCVPTLKNTVVATSYVVTYTGGTIGSIYGFNIDATTRPYGVWIVIANWEGYIKDNSIYNAVTAGTFSNIVDNIDWKITGNKIYNNGLYNIWHRLNPNQTALGTIEKNIMHSSTDGITYASNQAGLTINSNINNNLIYNHSNIGVILDTTIGSGEYSGTCENNTIINNTNYGIYYSSNTFSGTIRNNIVNNNGSDLFKETLSGSTPTITESIYYTNSGFTLGAGMIQTNDPKFCRTIQPVQLGISADSQAYRSDTSANDMGAHFRMIEINASNIIINGFDIDGQEAYNNGIFIADTVNHTGTIIKWCSIFDFQGIAIDLYDDNTDTDAQILNCKIYENGNGTKLSYGGNTIQECLIYRNTIFNIHTDRTGLICNHNVLWGGQYGIYFESNSGAAIFTNNIVSENSLYGIFSEILLTATYCCITDAVNPNVNKASVTNISDDPNFINTNEGEENFRIKTIENGFVKDSPCKDLSNDDPAIDIGTYEIDRDLTGDYWRKYPLVYNPRNIDFGTTVPGLTKFINAVGSLDLFGKDDKQFFVFKYNRRQYSDETDRKKLRYLSTLMKTRVNELPDERVIMRLSFLPSRNLENGIAATIDSVNKTITDSGVDLVENEWKGFFAGVKFEADSGNGTISAAGKTLTVSPSPGWTVNQFAPDGEKKHYFPNNGYWYTVLSNTADALTLSDPEDRLVNDSNIDWSIEKYFKVLECFENEYIVEDLNDELMSGSYDYYIGFIEVVIQKPGMKFIQTRYFFQKENWKTGYQLIFQEI